MSPIITIIIGGCRAFSAQTVLAAYPSAAQAEGAAKGFKSQKQTIRMLEKNRCHASIMDAGLQSI